MIAAHPADRVQLVGRVHAASAGAPVPEALATVVDSEGHVVGSAITGADGQFVFNDLQAGAYTIIATGYPSVTAEVHLGPGAPTEAVITFRPPTLAYAVPSNGAPGRSFARDAAMGLDQLDALERA